MPNSSDLPKVIQLQLDKREAHTVATALAVLAALRCRNTLAATKGVIMSRVNIPPELFIDLHNNLSERLSTLIQTSWPKSKPIITSSTGV